MIKLVFIFIGLIFLNNCSFNENSRLWKDEQKIPQNQNNIKKVFAENKKKVAELNQDLNLNLSAIKTKNKIVDNKNNFGSQSYIGDLKKIARYKYSKFEEVNNFNFKPLFLKDGIIFFDKKGSIIRYDNNHKVLWKKNHYSKAEKKLKPKLNFLLDNQNIIIADSIAKYYSVNLTTGELNWSNYNTYPFNSEIKKYKDKIFIIDYKNNLNCYKIIDGSECWSVQTDDSFTVSNLKFSLIIIDKKIIFNNSIGDITAVDIDTGLIIWQLPTQNNSIINETYNFKISKLVSDGSSIYFSNNKNQFYSINVNTGTINWINEINSNIRPVLIENIIITVSNEGFLYVVDKIKGNIIKINDLFVNYKVKKRKQIYPIGFAVGGNKLYLTNSDGKIIVYDLSNGEIIKSEKVSRNLISEPMIFNGNLFVVRNGSIVKYN